MSSSCVRDILLVLIRETARTNTLLLYNFPRIIHRQIYCTVARRCAQGGKEGRRKRRKDAYKFKSLNFLALLQSLAVQTAMLQYCIVR